MQNDPIIVSMETDFTASAYTFFLAPGDSKPVPLKSFAWTWKASAIKSAIASAWVPGANTTTGGTIDDNVKTHALWTHKLINKKKQ